MDLFWERTHFKKTKFQTIFVAINHHQSSEAEGSLYLIVFQPNFMPTHAGRKDHDSKLLWLSKSQIFANFMS